MDKIDFNESDAKALKTLTKQGPLGKRALFIMQYFFLRYDFKDFVKDVRENLKTYDTKSSLPTEINNKIEDFIYKSGIFETLPNMFLADRFIFRVLEEYIFLKKFEGNYKKSFALLTYSDYDQNMTDMISENDEPVELRLEFPISTKKEELIDYINSVWNEHSQQKIWLKEKDTVRFREKENFFRDLKIYNEYLDIESLSVSQRKLQKIGYIEFEVLKRLKAKYKEAFPDDGTVRSVASRLKNTPITITKDGPLTIDDF